MVDAEVRHIINRNYQRAEQILRDKMDKLHTMAEALMKYETINQGQIQDILADLPIREPANWRHPAPACDAPTSSSSLSSDGQADESITT